MAFNPFRTFRKHQRTIFALLVVLCMVVFIFSWGQGDLFTRIMASIGAGRKQGMLVTTLHGKKVYQGDLDQVGHQRKVAFEYLLPLFQRGAYRQMQQFGFDPRQIQADMLQQFTFNLMDRQFGRFGPPFYVVSEPSQLLDFMNWRTEADRLGVTLTDVDLTKAIARAAGLEPGDIFGGKPFLTSARTTQFLQMSQAARGMSAAELMKAISDEFRVLMAQEALAGSPPDQPRGMGSDFASVTPYEFYQYYRDQRATLRVWMLPIDVQQFVEEARKTTKPTEEQLTEFFSRYKGVEAGPARDRPGFKEPARASVEWISAGPDIPYFKEEVRRQFERNRVVGIWSSALTAGTTGSWLNLAEASFLYEPTLAKYGDYVERESKWEIQGDKRFHELSLSHPFHIVSEIGSAFAAAANPVTGTAALPGAMSAWVGSAGAFESQEAQRLQSRLLSMQLAMLTQPFGLPCGGSLLPPIILPTSGQYPFESPLRYGLRGGKIEPLYQDFWEARGQLLQQVLSEKTDEVVGTVMEKLFNDLAADKGKKGAVDKKVAAAVLKYGLRSGAPKDPERDRIDPLGDDMFDQRELETKQLEQLKKLRDDYLAARNTDRVDLFSRFLLQELTGTYDPVPFHRLRGDHYIVWRTKFTPAYEPSSLDKVRKKVEDEWYFEEARKLAQKRARALTAKVASEWKDEAPGIIGKKLIDEAHQEGFTLNGVARLVSQSAVDKAGGREYKAYDVPKSYIEYPRPNMVDQLVKQLTKPGQTMILSDLPKRHFYVALLEERDNQTNLKDFVEVYSKTPNDDKLWTENLLPAKRGENLQTVVKGLRISAGAKLTASGDYELPPGVRGASTSENENSPN